MNRITYGQNLRYLRRLKDLTQKDMADAIHITPAAYAHFETGRSFPDDRALVELCNILEYKDLYKMLTVCLKTNVHTLV